MATIAIFGTGPHPQTGIRVHLRVCEWSLSHNVDYPFHKKTITVKLLQGLQKDIGVTVAKYQCWSKINFTFPSQKTRYVMWK